MMTIQLIFLDLWFSSRHAQIFQISKRCPTHMIMKNQTGCQSTTWTNNISDSSSITQWQSTFGFANFPLSHILPVLSPLLLSHSTPFPPLSESQPNSQILGMASNTLMSCGIATATAFPSVLSSSKSKFATAVSLPSVNASSRFTMSAEWMPGQPRPPYLDGSAPG